MAETSEIVWRPSEERLEASRLTALIREMGAADYHDLYARSLDDPGWFWHGLLKFLEIRFYQPYHTVLDVSRGKAWADWCVGGTTNLYLNCLEKHRDTLVWHQPFIEWQGEDERSRTLSYADFDAEVNQLAAALIELGVGAGDVVGLYLPMIAEVYVGFFACAKIGAVNMPLFSGFGPSPIATRLNEGNVKVVVTADGTWRRGFASPMKAALDEAIGEAPSVEAVIVVDHMAGEVALEMKAGRDHWWHDLVAGQRAPVATAELPAEAPLTLAFTSGTTGKPKGIIQTHVGFLTKVALDLDLMLDFTAEDCFFWLSDFGWMVGALTAVTPSYAGGRLLVAEGAPDRPRPDRFWQLIEDYQVTHFGIAPTAARAAMSLGRELADQHDLSSLKVMISGGEPATPDAWQWLFEVVGGGRLPIINISGGTEIGCSIVTGATVLAQKPCAFNGPSLGSGAAVFNDNGQPVAPGEVGELVMTQPSIGLTKSFWGPGGDERYLETYWQDFPDTWRHGDFAAIDEDGYWYLLGRSDDTFKIGGKRTGPAEIEALVVATGKVAEVAVIGLPDERAGEVICILAVPKQGHDGDDLGPALSAAVVAGMGRAYRPRHIHLVADLPRTRSMKIMRRLIRAVLLDQPTGDTSALANPEALAHLQGIKAG
ncbi:MAG: AMP-binding protein [Alphaproteobacteria bacterium]|jgi:acetyl-CoA synthetase|nr:AMP-binding protein [Alphaproteobacteria bacterium]MDP7164619.1 AMP-binding protein [Alphaproteobacteria bacterium]MDP7428624.1 AMP-binding protein [Alphaproteobacteria bacterium]